MRLKAEVCALLSAQLLVAAAEMLAASTNSSALAFEAPQPSYSLPSSSTSSLDKDSKSINHNLQDNDDNSADGNDYSDYSYRSQALAEEGDAKLRLVKHLLDDHEPRADLGFRCTYKGLYYASGAQVPIAEQPCLSCTCRRSILQCFLRVCPPDASVAAQMRSVGRNCRLEHEPQSCCPTLRCLDDVGVGSSKTGSELDANSTALLSARSVSAAPLVASAHTPTPVADLKAPPDLSTRVGFDQASANDDGQQSAANSTSETSDDGIAAKDSVLLISSMPPPANGSLNKDASNFSLTNIGNGNKSGSADYALMMDALIDALYARATQISGLRNLQGSCLLNGSIYVEGSAVIAPPFGSAATNQQLKSASSCQHCYCIRSKVMCVRPKCQLSISGCAPRFASPAACCPTSYECASTQLPTTLIAQNATIGVRVLDALDAMAKLGDSSVGAGGSGTTNSGSVQATDELSARQAPTATSSGSIYAALSRFLRMFIDGSANVGAGSINGSSLGALPATNATVETAPEFSNSENSASTALKTDVGIGEARSAAALIKDQQQSGNLALIGEPFIQADEPVISTMNVATTTPQRPSDASPETASFLEPMTRLGPLVAAPESPAGCAENGRTYAIGEQIPTLEKCRHCYCGRDGFKECKMIECSLKQAKDNACKPIVPEGHCCPVKYLCPSLEDLVVSLQQQQQPQSQQNGQWPEKRSRSEDKIENGNQAAKNLEQKEQLEQSESPMLTGDQGDIKLRKSQSNDRTAAGDPDCATNSSDTSVDDIRGLTAVVGQASLNDTTLSLSLPETNENSTPASLTSENDSIAGEMKSNSTNAATAAELAKFIMQIDSVVQPASNLSYENEQRALATVQPPSGPPVESQDLTTIPPPVQTPVDRSGTSFEYAAQVELAAVKQRPLGQQHAQIQHSERDSRSTDDAASAGDILGENRASEVANSGVDLVTEQPQTITEPTQTTQSQPANVDFDDELGAAATANHTIKTSDASLDPTPAPVTAGAEQQQQPVGWMRSISHLARSLGRRITRYDTSDNATDEPAVIRQRSADLQPASSPSHGFASYLSSTRPPQSEVPSQQFSVFSELLQSVLDRSLSSTVSSRSDQTDCAASSSASSSARQAKQQQPSLSGKIQLAANDPAIGHPQNELTDIITAPPSVVEPEIVTSSTTDAGEDPTLAANTFARRSGQAQITAPLAVRVIAVTSNSAEAPATINIKQQGCFDPLSGRTFASKEHIPKRDPCLTCTCVLGKELCQTQNCPKPPADNCRAGHRRPNECCPSYTCANPPPLQLPQPRHQLQMSPSLAASQFSGRSLPAQRSMQAPNTSELAPVSGLVSPSFGARGSPQASKVLKAPMHPMQHMQTPQQQLTSVNQNVVQTQPQPAQHRRLQFPSQPIRTSEVQNALPAYLRFKPLDVARVGASSQLDSRIPTQLTGQNNGNVQQHQFQQQRPSSLQSQSVWQPHQLQFVGDALRRVANDNNNNRADIGASQWRPPSVAPFSPPSLQASSTNSALVPIRAPSPEMSVNSQWLLSTKDESMRIPRVPLPAPSPPTPLLVSSTSVGTTLPSSFAHPAIVPKFRDLSLTELSSTSSTTEFAPSTKSETSTSTPTTTTELTSTTSRSTSERTTEAESSPPSASQASTAITVGGTSQDTSTELSTTTTTIIPPPQTPQHQQSSEPVFDLFGSFTKVSECDIYGRIFKVGESISELSNECTSCTCTQNGVDCQSKC